MLFGHPLIVTENAGDALWRTLGSTMSDVSTSILCPRQTYLVPVVVRHYL